MIQLMCCQDLAGDHLLTLVFEAVSFSSVWVGVGWGGISVE